MRSPLSPFFFFTVLRINAIRLPFQVRYSNDPSTTYARRDANIISITNSGNAQYLSNITIGGQELPVLLDTGSSDLWVSFPGTVPSNMTDLDKSLTLSYAVGKASGNIHTTSVGFGGYTVDDQAFLYVANASTFTTNIFSQGYAGLLGLGPNTGSSITNKIDAKDNSGDTLLNRIFQQDKGTSNYISFILDRKFDPAENLTGQFTISEVIPQFSNITNMPKLDVETVYKLLQKDQHWQALTDKDIGIIGPDGNPLSVDSIVPKAPDGQLVAVIDSGFTFSQVPRSVSDAIYGRVQNAYYDSDAEFWMIPCGQILNLTFNFGGISYPIHPLDVVDDNFAKQDPSGKRVCIGAFQPITSAFSILGGYDMILGMSFLRNAYTLLDYGDWVEGTSVSSSPYIQMIPLTNVAAAHADFVQVRLSGNDSTSSQQYALLPKSEAQSSPISAQEKKAMFQEMILSRWPYIFVGCLAFIALVIGLCIWRCCKARKTRSRKNVEVLALGTARRSMSSVAKPSSDWNQDSGPYGHPAMHFYQPNDAYSSNVSTSTVDLKRGDLLQHYPPSVPVRY